MGENELSYCELRAKEVVNAGDGKRLGRIIDLLFSCETGTVSGIVVPLTRRSVFGKNQDVFIPWRCVQKIGEDVILVTMSADEAGRLSCESRDPCGKKESGCKKCPPPKHEGDLGAPPHPGCDYRCEKCMLFDCAYRWSQTGV